MRPKFEYIRQLNHKLRQITLKIRDVDFKEILVIYRRKNIIKALDSQFTHTDFYAFIFALCDIFEVKSSFVKEEIDRLSKILHEKIEICEKYAFRMDEEDE